MAKKVISEFVIERIPRYYKCLEEMMDNGIESVYSNELSGLMQLPSDRIRQDLHNFGSFGKKKSGYNVKKLHDALGEILGIDRTHSMIIIGYGNLGRALLDYDLKKYGFITKAIFDVRPELMKENKQGVPVLNINQMEDFIRKERIEIAVLTLPIDSAKEVVRCLVQCKIKAIWNFVHLDPYLDLGVPKDIAVVNVHLIDSLMRISFHINDYKYEKIRD